MDSSLLDTQWVWHPHWVDRAEDSAGALVHFRKSITLQHLPTKGVHIQISADTKYKLYINSILVSIGPVKGDECLWFYDELDIKPYLEVGTNHICVRVLRFYHSTPFATSFPRLPSPGLFIRNVDPDDLLAFKLRSDDTWETAIDLSTRLPIDIKEDDFLHVYEDVDKELGSDLLWLPAKLLTFSTSHGITPPWKLCKRLIPFPRFGTVQIKAIHNIQSTHSLAEWANALLSPKTAPNICLAAGTSHHVELEAEYHLTGLVYFRFQKPRYPGSKIKVTYSECYEEAPHQIPYLRRKGNRCDTTRKLIGPEDTYTFGGTMNSTANLHYHDTEEDEEIFAPFHLRTLRFIALDINVADSSDLLMKGIDLITTTYPLDVLADFSVPAATEAHMYRELWTTSIRTLTNCMHDCYEDCPFYEQLQYAMDTRSSALFTYCVSGDDRMARQAIKQLHNSYNPTLGLTGSRAPSHQAQIIPHFSLFWICMITDHFEHFNDIDFVRQFMPECDGVFESFARRIDPSLGLVRSLQRSTHWDFVDWATEWRPMGIPQAAEHTGFQSYTNMLYVYSLKRAAKLLTAIGRQALAAEYQSRADAIVRALQAHCFDGIFFTDGLASKADITQDYSQHTQIWAVLSGAAIDGIAREILSQSLSSPVLAASTNTPSRHFTPTSVAMSFYTLRALSIVGGDLYDKHFHTFWEPWREQLSQNLTTWCEDNVSQRSDCHAWGCAPLYEFTTEVAGIRPAAPGWAVLAFKPRLALFPELEAKVPFGSGDSGSGIAHVRWRRERNEVKVYLSLTMNSGERPVVPVQATLPDGEVKMMDGADEIIFTVLIE